MLWRRLHALILAMTLTCFFEFGLVRDDALSHHSVVVVSCSHLPVSSDALRLISWFGAAGVFGVETGASLEVAHAPQTFLTQRWKKWRKMKRGWDGCSEKWSWCVIPGSGAKCERILSVPRFISCSVGVRAACCNIVLLLHAVKLNNLSLLLSFLLLVCSVDVRLYRQPEERGLR